MGNIKSVLKELYPGKEVYSEEEMSSARRIMDASVMRTGRSSRLPSVYIPVGGEYVYGGIRYKCVIRPSVAPRDCCSGCDFRCLKYPCPAALQCSKFDRRDGRFVWFVRVETK